jgi:hypothetical protein
MMRRRKIVIGTVACAFAVLILLLAAVTIAPKAVDTETVKAKVRSELLKVAGVESDQPGQLQADLNGFSPHLKFLYAKDELNLKNILTFLFKGNLHKATVDQFVSDNPWLAGWLYGDFRAHIDIKNSLKSEAWGELRGKQIVYPWEPKTPLTINDLSLEDRLKYTVICHL